MEYHGGTANVKVENEPVSERETTIKIELESTQLEVQLQITPAGESVTNELENTENVFENVQLAIKEEINFSVAENNIVTDKNVAENFLVEKDSSEPTIEHNYNSDVKEEGFDKGYNELGFDDGSIDSNEATALGHVEACLQDYDDSENSGIRNEQALQNFIVKNETTVLPDTVSAGEIIPDFLEQSTQKYSFVTKIPGDMVDSIANGMFDDENYIVPNGESECSTAAQNSSLLEVSKETEPYDVSQFQLNSITGDILSLEQEAYTAINKKDTVFCPKCSKICSKRNIKRHLLVHKAIENRKNGVEKGLLTRKLNKKKLYVKLNQYHCPLCPKIYRDKSGLMKHLKSFHKLEENLHELVEEFNKVHQNSVITSEKVKEVEVQQNSNDSEDTSQTESKDGYKCTCGKVFKRRTTMETCLRSHETSESELHHFKCMTCSKQYRNKEELASHRKRMHRKRFPCKFCPTGFNNRRKLFKHLQIHQKVHLTEYKVIEEVVKGKHKLKCFICLKTCEELSELKTHVMTEHTVPYQCGHCNDKFPGILDFGNHLKADHPEVEGQSVMDVLEAFSRLIQEWKCKECGIQFLEPDKLALHEIEQHSPEIKADPQFQCPDCRRVFVSQKGLTSHRRIHEVEVVEKTTVEDMGVMCLECRLMCKDMHALTSHMRFHSLDRKYVCKFCDFRFATVEKRRAHVEIHTGDMKFVCFICEYQCTSLNRLKKHKESLKHANMKEYLLTGKPLLEESTSDVKDKKNSGAKKRKKSKSESDSDSETDKSNLNESGEVSCDICGDNFSSEPEMLEHKQTHPFIEFPNDDKPTRIFFK